jgi:DNA-binding transcriptional ArsR family regulator
MTMTAPVDDALQAATVAARLFQSLADPTRLRILLRLHRGECRVVDLMTEVGLAQATVSQHLACLRACGLIRSRAVGRQNLYEIAVPEVRALLAAADLVLDNVGHDVALCTLLPGQP